MDKDQAHTTIRTDSRVFSLRLLGAVAGDMIGSVHEFRPHKSTQFELFTPHCSFTDDSVLTLAVADAIANHKTYLECIRAYPKKYPGRGYGSNFWGWVISDLTEPYNSFGNGSAMRVSPVAWAFNTPKKVLLEAERSAEVTHNHPEGIKGAQAVALAIFLARKGKSKDDIRSEINERFHYDLTGSLDEIRPYYHFDETCQGSVPQAIIAFLESNSFEDAVRKAVSLGGDADTQGAITGSIAEAFYGGVPEEIVTQVRKRLPPELWQLIEEFNQKIT